MSFELYLQSFSNGEPAGIPILAIRDAFGSALVELEDDYWQVQYGPDQSTDLFLRSLPSQPTLIHNVSIHRPCVDARLYEGIWELMEMPGTVLYFPGGSAPLARAKSAGASMPADLQKSLGEPVLILGATDISLAIEGC